MAQVLSAFHLHPWSSTWLSLFDSTFSALYFFLFLLPVFFSLFFLFYLELFPELLYTKDMANLRRSATNESEDTYDVFNLLCLSRSVRRRPEKGSSAAGCRPEVLLEELVASSEGVVDPLPYRWPQRPDVVRLESVTTRSSRR